MKNVNVIVLLMGVLISTAALANPKSPADVKCEKGEQKSVIKDAEVSALNNRGLADEHSSIENAEFSGVVVNCINGNVSRKEYYFGVNSEIHPEMDSEDPAAGSLVLVRIIHGKAAGTQEHTVITGIDAGKFSNKVRSISTANKKMTRWVIDRVETIIDTEPAFADQVAATKSREASYKAYAECVDKYRAEHKAADEVEAGEACSQ